jgi:hypothetical protein
MNRVAIAVVGDRACSLEVAAVAEDLGRELAQHRRR